MYRECCGNTENEGMVSRSESSVGPDFKSRPAAEPPTDNGHQQRVVTVGQLVSELTSLQCV